MKELLTKKFAGMPGYVWLAAAGVGAYFLLNRQSSSASSTDSTDTGTADQSASNFGGGFGGGLGGAFAGGYPLVGAIPTDTRRPHAKCIKHDRNGKCIGWDCPQGKGKCR